MAKKKCCNRNCCIYATGIVGLILVILGALLVFIFDTAYVAIVENNLIIADGTESFEAWKAPPPYYLEFYVFNCTNPEEFLAGAAKTNSTFVKPRFQQLGPYVYRTEQVKDRTEFIENSSLGYEELKFRSTAKYYFEPGRSGGKETDIITTIDFIAVGAPAIVEYAFQMAQGSISALQKTAIRRSINSLIRDTNSQLLFQTTAGGLFFGFQTELLTSIVNTIELALGVDQLPDEFGLFQTMNNSAGWYEYKIYTGKGNYCLMNVVTEYDSMRMLPYWFGDNCNLINGTDGTTVPAFMNKNDRIYFFVDDLCRSMYATFYAEVDVKGLPGWEYRVPGELFEAPATNKENECFCPDLSLEVCAYDGGLLLSSCQSGAPVFMTSPHFLYAEHYLNYVEGLSPNEEEHATPLVYEPSTGIVLKADKRLQINMYLQPTDLYDILDGSFPEPYAFPVLWLNESYMTSDADADAAYKVLVVPANVFLILQIILCIVGSVMFLATICFIISNKFNASSKTTEMESVDSYKKPKHSDTPPSTRSYENRAVIDEPDVAYAVIQHDKKADAGSDHNTDNSSDDIPTTAL